VNRLGSIRGCCGFRISRRSGRLDGYYMNALQAASAGGQCAIVRLLLDILFSNGHFSRTPTRHNAEWRSHDPASALAVPVGINYLSAWRRIFACGQPCAIGAVEKCLHIFPSTIQADGLPVFSRSMSALACRTSLEYWRSDVALTDNSTMARALVAAPSTSMVVKAGVNHRCG
jgi:hypothetical protein